MPHAATKPTQASTATCRILHVNDSDADHRVLAELLERDRSFSFERAHSGLEALQQLRRKVHLPNLVIVTWSYARMACADFIDQMKSDKRLAVIPVIVIASAISPDEVMQAYDAGAACVLKQDPDPESLAGSLRAVKDFWGRVMLPFCDSPTQPMPNTEKAGAKTAGASRRSKSTAEHRRAVAKKAVQARWAKTKRDPSADG